MTSRFDLRKAGAAIEKQAAKITELQDKLDKAVEALEKSRDTFKRYGDLHSAKATRDADQKAAVNWALSMDMDETISEIKGSKASPVKPERDG